MKVYYNNDEIVIRTGVTLLELVEKTEVIEHKAIWLNGQHIALSALTIQLKENDHIKVVRIRGGG